MKQTCRLRWLCTAGRSGVVLSSLSVLLLRLASGTEYSQQRLASYLSFITMHHILSRGSFRCAVRATTTALNGGAASRNQSKPLSLLQLGKLSVGGRRSVYTWKTTPTLTKIVATIGPVSEDFEPLQQVLLKVVFLLHCGLSCYCCTYVLEYALSVRNCIDGLRNTGIDKQSFTFTDSMLQPFTESCNESRFHRVESRVRLVCSHRWAFV